MKCCPCIDQLVSDGGSDPDFVPDAVTLAPVVQSVFANGMQVVGLIMMPVCLACRVKMLGTVSKAGLATG